MSAAFTFRSSEWHPGSQSLNELIPARPVLSTQLCHSGTAAWRRHWTTVSRTTRNRTMSTALLVSLLFAFARDAQSCEAATTVSAPARVESLLRTMGGRDAWARTIAMRVEARHYEADLQEPYENRILMSFESLQVRIEARSSSINRVRVVNGDAGWHISEKNPLRPMTSTQIAEDRRWWDAHIYRTIHRLAKRDPQLTAHLAVDGRLQIKQLDGSQLMWIRQNACGEPLQFGVGEAQAGTIFGPLLSQAGITIPSFSVSPDGTWRAIIKGIEANPDLTRVDFSKP